MAKTGLPRIAAVMAAHNADKTLLEAVNSLLIDKIPIDIYIVDDASKTPATELFRGKIPPYIKIMRQEINVGAAKARNIALREILSRDYEFAAVMDSDDIALPGRISKTIDYLDAHPQVAAVGGWAHCVDEETLEPLYDLCHPLENDAIRRLMMLDARFVHSTVTLRVAALRKAGLYNEKFPVAQDYEIMMRFAQEYKLANLPEYLLRYRVCKNGISVKRMTKQRRARLQIQGMYFQPQQPLAWYGLARSFVRVLIPSFIVEAVKTLTGKKS